MRVSVCQHLGQQFDCALKSGVHSADAGILARVHGARRAERVMGKPSLLIPQLRYQPRFEDHLGAFDPLGVGMGLPIASALCWLMGPLSFALPLVSSAMVVSVTEDRG